MKVFLVGGAVRDHVLGIESKDRDYVVVGATPREMLSLGYKQVGADFPVFLHPETNEEYALARIERKTGLGYNGFETDYNPNVTLEEDLSRRDLTMNSMAMDLETGEVIDPFHGQLDLTARVIRHTSEAFAEDPVRVLRVARFAARYCFTIAPETTKLMKQLVASGELNHLTKERVWTETHKALHENLAWIYFQALYLCGADKVLFPEFNFKSVNSKNLNALIAACCNNEDIITRYGALFCNISDGESISIRLKAPNEFITVAKHVSNYSNDFSNATKLSSKELLKLFKNLEYNRETKKALTFIKICELNTNNLKTVMFLHKVLIALVKVSIATIDSTGLSGKEIGLALDAARIKAIQGVINSVKV